MPKIVAEVLKDASLRNLKPGADKIEIPDAGAKGLYFVVYPSGVRSFVFRYRNADKAQKRLTLGTYPALSLGDARTVAKDHATLVSQGGDPSIVEVEATPAPIVTVGRVLDLYLKEHVKTKLKPGNAYDVECTIEKDIRPFWKDRDIKSITGTDVKELIGRVVARGARTKANRVHSLVSKFFNWCIDEEVLTVSPLGRINKPAKENKRERVLSDAEMRLVWLAAEQCRYPFGPIVQMLMLTGQRREEVCDSSWHEFNTDDNDWIMAGTRTKNGNPHLIPLSPALVAVLENAPRIACKPGLDFVFTKTGETSFSGYSRGKVRLDSIIKKIAEAEADERGDEAVVVADWTIHDIRRTVSTGMAKLRVEPHVIEAILNHKSGKISGVAAIYNLYQYYPEKREALEKWALHLAAIVAAAPGSNVLPLRKSA